METNLMEHSLMKDSGIEWIGKIPEDWYICRIKYVASLKGRIGWQGLNSSDYTGNGPYLITGTDFSNDGINWDTCVHITKERYDEAPEIHVKNNDLLITKDGTIGKVALIRECPDEVSLNSGVLLIRKLNANNYNDEYMRYILLSDIFYKWYENSQTGNSTIRHLYQEQFSNFKFPFPSLFEQTKIATFLDSKTSEIKSLIDNLNKQIESLKEYKKSLIYKCVTKGVDDSVPLKDSGIEWIGQIPENWKIERLQWHLREIKENNNPIKADKVLSLTNKDGVIPYEEKGAQGNISKEDYSQYKLAYPGTIVANSMNILIGSVGICNYFGCVSPVYYVYKANEQSNLKFINYLFQTIPFQKELRKYANGILEIRLRVSSDDILKRQICSPSLEEQNQIVDFLDNKCEKIDELISMQEAEIDKLTEYQKSLIYEYVTGKKEVITEGLR